MGWWRLGRRVDKKTKIGLEFPNKSKPLGHWSCEYEVDVGRGAGWRCARTREGGHGCAKNKCTLLETRSLLRAWGFAEGQISSTRQRHSLPRAFLRGPRQRKALGKVVFAKGLALGKDDLSKFGLLGNGAAEARQPLPRANRQTLGKGF